MFRGSAWSQGVSARGVPGPRGCLLSGGCLLPGVPGPGGRPGGVPPPGRALLRAVRILLECILVSIEIE